MPPSRNWNRVPFSARLRHPSTVCVPARLVVMMCVLLAGCPRTDSEDSSAIEAPTYQGVHLRFVVPKSLQLEQRWAPAVNDWADVNAASVEVIELDFAEPTSTWLDQIANKPTSLVLLPVPQLGELVGAGIAAPFPADADSEALGAYQPPMPLRTAVATVGNAETFAVASSPTPVVAVRSDLLRAAGRSAPATWQEYDRLVAEREQWAPGLTAVEPRAAASISTLFLARALSAAKHPAQLSVELDVSDGTPLIATEPYVRALAEMQALTPHLAEQVGDMTPVDCVKALADGAAAIAIVWASAGDVPLPTMAQKQTDAELKFYPLPGRREVFDREDETWTTPDGDGVNRPALCGFAGYSAAVTNVGTDIEQAAAWDLWGLLMRYQAEQTILPMQGLIATGSDTGADALLTALSPAEAGSYAQAQADNLQNSLLVCELPMLGRTRLHAALTSAVQKALDDGVEPATALQQARDEWTQIIDEIGRTRVLNSYRVRLGLVRLPE